MDMKSDLNKITLEKCSSGIQGLDEITEGGLPKGRPTLICHAISDKWSRK